MNHVRKVMKNKKELFCWLIILTLGILSAVLPPSGKTALWDELCAVLMIWIAGFYVIRKIAKAKKASKSSEKICRFLTVIILLLIGCWFSKNLAADAFWGAKTLTLYHPKTSHYQGHTGIFSNHYYLSGENADGDLCRVEISAKEYQSLSGQIMDKAEIQYYEHTKRLLRCRP